MNVSATWLSPLLAVSYGVALRFFALRVWILALAAPLGAAALAGVWAGVEAGQGPGMESAAGIERAALVLLGCLHHLLPPLAAIFILAPSDQEGLDLLLARPLGWPSLLLGRWLGAAALFGGCHLALAAALWAAAATGGGGPGGRLYREASELSLLPADGAPRSAEGLSRPWPSGPPERSWIEAVEGARGYTFLFEGLEPGREQRARIWVLAAQVLTHRESGESPSAAPAAPAGSHRELARSNSIGLNVSFADPERGGDWMNTERLLVYDEGPTDFVVPARAVGRDGKLVVKVVTAGDPVEDVPGMIVGRRFFWFDPAGEDDPVLWRDLRIVVGEVSFAGNALRASLEALGKLLLVTAVAVAATALFSSGVAIGVVLTVYLFSSASPFLREAVNTLQSQSALLLLDPHGHSALKPSGFERGLKVFLESLTAILPDFSRFSGLRRLDSGEAVRWSEMARAAAWAAAYALAALGVAAAALGGRDLRR